MPDFDINSVIAGLKVMAYGLSGVFAALILFYSCIKLMMFAAKRLQPKKEEG